MKILFLQLIGLTCVITKFYMFHRVTVLRDDLLARGTDMTLGAKFVFIAIFLGLTATWISAMLFMTGIAA